ncbi:MAG: class I SAM-dependent methyltransferase [Actinomycetota bacterium]
MKSTLRKEARVAGRSTQSDRVRMVRADRLELNRRGWDARSAKYQRDVGGREMYGGSVRWGPNQFEEDHLGVLGDVEGKRVLEVGCGAAQFGIELAKLGAIVTGIDLSSEQIRHARQNIADAHVQMKVSRANAERTGLPDDSFDIVVSDFAAGFMDLDALLKEIARLLVPGGFCALSWSSPILDCMTGAGEPPVLGIKYSYFDRTPWVDEGRDSTYEFKRTYGDWVRAIAQSGLVLEDLIEPQAPRGAPHMQWPNFKWQRTSMIPGTSIWKARKPLVESPRKRIRSSPKASRRA